MATEKCAVCGDSVAFETTTHVLVNPKHEDGVADHYVCRPCYDEHLEGLFAAGEEDGEEGLDEAGANEAVDDEGGADGEKAADEVAGDESDDAGVDAPDSDAEADAVR